MSFCSGLLLFTILSVVGLLTWRVSSCCLGRLGHRELELLLIVEAIAAWLVLLDSHGHWGLHGHWEHLGELRWLLQLLKLRHWHHVWLEVAVHTVHLRFWLLRGTILLGSTRGSLSHHLKLLQLLQVLLADKIADLGVGRLAKLLELLEVPLVC